MTESERRAVRALIAAAKRERMPNRAVSPPLGKRPPKYDGPTGGTRSCLFCGSEFEWKAEGAWRKKFCSRNHKALHWRREERRENAVRTTA